MIKVVVVGFNGALASPITGAIDLFALAGVTWQRIQGQQPKPLFQVQLASLGGEPVRCINHLQLTAHTALEQIRHCDLLLVPTIGGPIERTLEQNPRLLTELVRLHQQGAVLASNCTGAFLLAQAGLLNEQPATTHWGFAERFAQRFPTVNLQPERLMTEGQQVFCAGGGMAWFHLALHLIGRYCGEEVAAATAKAHVLDLAPISQSAYASVPAPRLHQDPVIHHIQDALAQRLSQMISFEQIADEFGLTQRTLIRRFKAATQKTPLAYLQSLRVEAAKQQLERSGLPLEHVVQQVGYEDISSFTRLFKRATGLSPSQYRKRFSGNR